MHHRPLPANDEALDALTELVNIGVGRAAASLSDLISERIELNVPRVRWQSAPAVALETRTDEHSCVTVVAQEFHGRIRGRAALMFPPESGLILAQLLSGTDTVATEFDAELAGVLLEVGNIVLNAVLGSFANAAADAFDYSLPTLYEDHQALVRVLSLGDMSPELLIADVEFRVHRSEIHGTIALVFAGGCIQTLLERAVAWT